MRDALAVILTWFGPDIRRELGNTSFQETAQHSGQYLKELLTFHFT